MRVRVGTIATTHTPRSLDRHRNHSRLPLRVPNLVALPVIISANIATCSHLPDTGRFRLLDPPFAVSVH
jgi:hypothetical protein